MDALNNLRWLVDAVIAFTVIEAVVLALHHRRTGAGVAPQQFLLNMVSGLCLMLALHFALGSADAAWVAVALCAAGLAHAADLLLRWQRRGPPRRPAAASAPALTRTAP